MAKFTSTQGRYLAFIHAYTQLHNCPPSESEIAAALCVSPPSVNQMVKMLEKRGLSLRKPGQPRSLKILISEDEIPSWNNRKSSNTSTKSGKAKAPKPSEVAPPVPPANLYVLSVFLRSAPLGDRYLNESKLRFQP